MMNKEAFLVGYLQKEGTKSSQAPNIYNPTKDLKKFYGDDFQKVLAARREAIEQSKTKGFPVFQNPRSSGRESPTFRQPWKTGNFPKILQKSDPKKLKNSLGPEKWAALKHMSNNYGAEPRSNIVSFPSDYKSKKRPDHKSKKRLSHIAAQRNGLQDWMGNSDFSEYTEKLVNKRKLSTKLHEFTHTSTYDIPYNSDMFDMEVLFYNLKPPYPFIENDELAPPAAGLKRVHYKLTGRNFKNRQDFDKWTEWLVNLDPSVPKQEKMLKKIGNLDSEALRARNYLGYFKKERALAKKNNMMLYKKEHYDNLYQRFKDFLYTIGKLVVKANPSKTSRRRG